jgi:hypothetical protein
MPATIEDPPRSRKPSAHSRGLAENQPLDAHATMQTVDPYEGHSGEQPDPQCGR